MDEIKPMSTETERAADQLELVREVLTKCRDQFALYAKLHRAKGTVDGYDKAKVNASFARMCNLALEGSPTVAALSQPSAPAPLCPVCGKDFNLGADPSLYPVSTQM